MSEQGSGQRDAHGAGEQIQRLLFVGGLTVLLSPNG